MMFEFDKENFFDLLNRQKFGLTSTEEDAIIRQTFQLFPREAGLVLDELKAIERDQQAQSNRVNPDSRLAAKAILEMADQQKGNHKRLLRWPIVATVSVSLFLLVMLIWPLLVSKVDAGSETAVTLKLSGGRTYVLPGTKDTSFHTAGTTFNSSGGILRFVHSGQTVSGDPTLSVPAGKTFTILLPDSSKIELNALTSCRFPVRHGGTNREVFLDGEAFFDIRPDPLHPFRVHTPAADIFVLGTSFAVSTYDNHFKASLVTGKVVLRHKTQKIELVPGQQTSLDTVTGRFSVTDFDPAAELGWRSGKYIFTDAPLPTLSPAIRRCYGLDLEILTPGVTRRTFSGILYKDKPVEVFLHHLVTTGLIDSFEIRKQVIYLH